MLNVIAKRKREKLEVDAKLHNMKLKPALTSIGVTKEERAEYDQQAKEAHEKLMKRYKERKNKEG